VLAWGQESARFAITAWHSNHSPGGDKLYRVYSLPFTVLLNRLYVNPWVVLFVHSAPTSPCGVQGGVDVWRSE